MTPRSICITDCTSPVRFTAEVLVAPRSFAARQRSMRPCTFSANSTTRYPINSGTKLRRPSAFCPQSTALIADVAFELGPRLCPPDRLPGGCSASPGFTSSFACGDHTTKTYDPRSCAECSLVCLNTCSARTRDSIMTLLTCSILDDAHRHRGQPGDSVSCRDCLLQTVWRVLPVQRLMLLEALITYSIGPCL